MRDYVTHRREALEYDEFVRQKVELAQAQCAAGLTISNEEVEAAATIHRAELMQRHRKWPASGS